MSNINADVLRKEDTAAAHLAGGIRQKQLGFANDTHDLIFRASTDTYYKYHPEGADIIGGNLYTDRYVYHNGDLDTYLDFTTNQLVVRVGNTEVAMYTTTGLAVAGTLSVTNLLGIGTASPANILHVYKNANEACVTRTENVNTGNAVTVGHDIVADATHYLSVGQYGANTAMASAGQTTAGMGLIINRGGGLLICEYDNVPICFATNNITRMTIAAGGNVGIGIQAAGSLLHQQKLADDNEHTLDVYSDNNGNVGRLVFRRSLRDTVGYTANSTGSYLGSMTFYGVDSGNVGWAKAAEIRVVQDGGAEATYTPSKIIFETYNGAAVNTNQFVLNSNNTFSFAGAGTITGAITNSALTATGICYAATSGLLSTNHAVFNYDSGTNNGIGIGATAMAGCRAYLSHVVTNVTGLNTIYIENKTTSTVAAAYNNVTFYMQSHGYGSVDNTGTLWGMIFESFGRNTAATITTMIGLDFFFGHSSGNGTITNSIGMVIRPYANTGSTITNMYGIQIIAPAGSGTITNKWPIYSAWDAQSQFVGGITILSDANYMKWGAGEDLGIRYNGTDAEFTHLVGSGSFLFTNGNVGVGVTATAARLDVIGTNGNMLLGTSVADNTEKYSHLGTRHYDTDEEPFYFINTVTGGDSNTVYVGGGYASGNAATSILFNTAANHTTLAGTTRMTITSAIITIGLPIQMGASTVIDMATNSSVFKPRLVTQAAMPTPASGELLIWKDSDDSVKRIVYNDGSEVVYVAMAAP